MLKGFKNKGLDELWSTSRSAKIDSKMHKRILVRLDALDVAMKPDDMNLPGFDFHSLNGFDPTRYSVHVNGPWCVTFEFDGTNAAKVNFEQYH
ncbi:MAG: type II toxin-antitoxin system RelE/ParE family toxin [Devosia sp.]